MNRTQKIEEQTPLTNLLILRHREVNYELIWIYLRSHLHLSLATLLLHEWWPFVIRKLILGFNVLKVYRSLTYDWIPIIFKNVPTWLIIHIFKIFAFFFFCGILPRVLSFLFEENKCQNTVKAIWLSLHGFGLISKKSQAWTSSSKLQDF